MDVRPGECQDFGVLGLWHDPATARRRRVYGLLVSLASSRYAFLAIALRQDRLPARFARAPASFAHHLREEASDVPGDRA